MILTRVVREPKGAATPGRFWFDDVPICYTLEDQDRLLEVAGASAKVYGETCIPRGLYEIRLTHSTRFNVIMPQVMEVPFFHGIRWHPANDISELEGCTAFGMARSDDGMKVMRSQEAYDKVLSMITPLINNGVKIFCQYE